MTISIGWWIIPTIITGLAAVWALRSGKEDGYGGAFDSFFCMIGAVILSLVAWCIYGLLT
jgi:hypothetical protein